MTCPRSLRSLKAGTDRTEHGAPFNAQPHPYTHNESGFDSQPSQASHQFHRSLNIKMEIKTPLPGDFYDPMLLRKDFNNQAALPPALGGPGHST